MTKKLTKIALVTGSSSSGIGRSILERLEQDGVTVITCGRGN